MKPTFTLDVGGTNIKYGMISPEGELLRQGEVPTHAEQGGKALLERMISLCAAEAGQFSAIGVSTCGQVNRADGSIRYATDNVPGYTGTAIAATLKERFSVPVAVENDVNAAALGEAHFGAAQDCSDFLCITYGTGIGGAVVINRQLYTGHGGSAGELGHMLLHAGGEPCTCGGRGCYEAYASTGALSRLAERRLGGAWNGRTLFAALNDGTPGVEELLREWCGEVAMGLASLVHIFEPQAIVLGGGIMKEPWILQTLRDRLPSLIMASYRDVELRPAKLGNTAGLYGAFASVHSL